MITSRYLTSEETNFLLSLKKEDIDMVLIKKMFADTFKKKKMFNTYDKFYLPANTQYVYNKTRLVTTPGRYLVNLLVLPEPYLKKFGYCNDELNKKNLGKLESRIGNMILNDELSTKEYAETYLDIGQWLFFGTAYFMNPTMNYNVHILPEHIKKRQAELFKEHEDALKNNNVVVSNKIEKEILTMMGDYYKSIGEEAYDYFEQEGMGKNLGSHKKTMVQVGPILDPASGKIHISKHNYWDGIPKEEIPNLPNLTIQAAVGRGVETQKSGYEIKKINSAMQSTVLADKGSDCKTPFTLQLELTAFNKDLLMYRYIVENNKLVQLDEDNIDSYVGKIIYLRTPMYCKQEDKLCNICAGEMFYKLDVRNMGLFAGVIGGSLSNMLMASMHDSSIRVKDIELENYIKER